MSASYYKMHHEPIPLLHQSNERKVPEGAVTILGKGPFITAMSPRAAITNVAISDTPRLEKAKGGSEG